MHRPIEGRHPNDHQKADSAIKAARFMQMARQPRQGWHVQRPSASSARLVQFLRIARGKLS